MKTRLLFVAATLLTPSLALAAQRTSLTSQFPDMNPEQVNLRAALIDASWDLPLDVLEKIPGAALTDLEQIEENGLASMVNPANANVTIPFTDLRLGSPGPEVLVERTFNSLETEAGEFGRGWSWAYGVRLRKTGEGIVVQEADGATIAFQELTPGRWSASNVGQEVVADGRGWRRFSKEAGESERYDAKGFLVERADAAGRKLVLRRDGSGKLSAIVAANGREIRVKTNADGRIVSMVDPAGRIATYDYAASRLVAVTVDGLVTGYAYDAEETLTQVTFPEGTKLHLSYNEGGMVSELRLGTEVVRAGFTFSKDQPALHGATIQEGTDSTRYTYDETAGTSHITFPDGTSEVRKFDTTCGCVTEAIVAEKTGRFVYDDEGRVLQMSGDDGTVHYTYGPRTIRSIETKGASPSKMTFDDSGNLVRIDAPGRAIELAYANGNLTTMMEKGVAGQLLEYSPLGDIVAVKNAKGDFARFEYDAAGMVTAIVRGDYLRMDFERRTGSFVPKIRLALKSKAKGTQTQELPLSEMTFLYGDSATAVPVKKAALEAAGGLKFASLAGMPLAGMRVSCYGMACAREKVLKCLVPVLANTLSPIGTPLKYNLQTGEFEIDLKEWATGATEDELKDAIKEAAKNQVEKAKKQGWFKRAVKKVGGFAKGLVQKAGKVVLKVARTLIKPIQVVLALKDAYGCFRDGNAAAKKWGCQKAELSPGLLQQFRHQTRPPGLMARSDA